MRATSVEDLIYLGEEGVEAVDLLAFLEKGIVLGKTTQGQLVHEVDLVGLDHMLILSTWRDKKHVSNSQSQKKKK